MKIFFEVLLLIRRFYKRLTPSFFLFFKRVYTKLYSKIFLRIQDVGATRYFIPVIAIRKSIFLARQWLFKSISLRRERTFSLRMFCELIAVKKSNKFAGSIILKTKYYKQAKNLYTNLQFLKFAKNNSKITYYNSKPKLFIKSKYNTRYKV